MGKFSQGFTMASVMRATSGATSGFDYMRIGLSAAVVFFHAIVVVDGSARWLWSTHAAAPIFLILAMFFSLSGFLVAGSLERSPSLLTFGAHRVLRIVPALSVEVILSALILGPLVTSSPLRTYFTSPVFFEYFWNIIGHIHFNLPGVFDTNPFPHRVNQSLWTVPYELECYIVLAAMALFGIHRNRWAFLAVTAFLHVLVYARAMTQDVVYERAHPLTLVLAFLAGICVYLFRDKISMKPVAIVSTACVTLLLSATDLGRYFGTAFVAITTAQLGLLNPPRSKFLRSGDYSYGIYLYAFPLQQLQIHLWPTTTSWLVNALSALCASLLFALFSWHMIEKRVLAQRHRVTDFLEAHIGDKLRALPFRLPQFSRPASEASSS